MIISGSRYFPTSKARMSVIRVEVGIKFTTFDVEVALSGPFLVK